MSKWEDKYNELKLNVDNMIQEQSSKMDELRRKQAEIGKDTESKDYKDLKAELKQANAEKKRLEQLKPNLGKVSNIIEKRENLKKQLDKLNKEAEFRKEMGEATKRKEELETEISNYQERHEKIIKELRNDKLSAQEKEKLENERAEISEKMSKAQDEWDKQDKDLQAGLGKKGDLSNLSQEEIMDKLKETDTKIKQCNVAARMLLEGKTWDDIRVKFENWQDRRFENKGEKLSKKDKLKTKSEEIEVEPEEIDVEEVGKKIEERVDAEVEPEVEVKPGRFARMANWFKKLFNKNKMLAEPEEIEVQPEEIEVEEAEPEKKEQENQQEKTSKRLAFMEELQQISEKSMAGVAAEEKAARQAAAKEKLAQMRAANRAAEAQKFGQDYADKSDFRQNNTGEER